jgi:hypothetical protein
LPSTSRASSRRRKKKGRREACSGIQRCDLGGGGGGGGAPGSSMRMRLSPGAESCNRELRAARLLFFAHLTAPDPRLMGMNIAVSSGRRCEWLVVSWENGPP